MNNMEEAYGILGLTPEATRQQLEQRYQLIVRKARAQEIKGTISLRTEAEMLAATRAYRYILGAEALKISSAYRAKRYGRFKRYSALAESVDHFLTYHKFAIVFSSLLLIFGTCAFFLQTQLNRSKAAAASIPMPHMTVMLVGPLSDPFADISSLENKAEQSMMDQLPEGSNHVDVQIVSIPENDRASTNRNHTDYRSIAVVTEKPDLYLVDRDHFEQLFHMGYLRKLAPWGTYGVNVSGSAFAKHLPATSKPLIAAISTEAEHPEHALRWIMDSKKSDGSPWYTE